MAVSSMTGFGSAERSWTLDEPGAAPRRVSAELRSVNARFLELKIRQPFGPGVEAGLRRQLEGALGRGRVELRINVELAGRGAQVDRDATAVGTGGEAGDGEERAAALIELGLDPARLEDFARAVAEVRRIASPHVELASVSPLELLSFSLARTGGGEAAAAPPSWLAELVGEALDALLAMRRAEGASLAEVLTAHLAGLDAARQALASAAAAEPARLLGAFSERLGALLAADEGGVAPDPERVAAEVALLVSRGDVTEELDRIESHLAQARRVLAQPAARGQGKTLDFVAQELLREFTTAGSKLAHPDASARVIEAKGILERLREQVQNVE